MTKFRDQFLPVPVGDKNDEEAPPGYKSCFSTETKKYVFVFKYSFGIGVLQAKTRSYKSYSNVE